MAEPDQLSTQINMDLKKDEWIQELKCVICNNYLSHFPIHTTSNAESVCGRCPLPTENYIRNHPYEVVSQNINFPCAYESEGCCETLLPKSIPEHEQQCLHRPLGCPTLDFTGCMTKVSQPNFIKHCHEVHSEYFLKDAGTNIDATKSQKYDYIVEFKNKLLLLRCEFEHETKLFTFALSQRVYYKLKFSCKNKSLSVKYNDADEAEIHEISLESLMSPDMLEFSVKMSLEAKLISLTVRKDINRVNRVKVWKCPSCSSIYALSPKWFNNNKGKDTKCPKCHNSFPSNKNAGFHT